MKTGQSACLIGLICATINFTLGSSAAQADLLFSDSFNYSTGSLAGDGPPPGSPPGQGAWSSLNFDPQVTAPGLVFPGLHTPGNAATLADNNDNNGDAAGAALTPVGMGDTSVVWIGFLIAHANGGTSGYAVVTFNEGFGATAPGFGMLFGQGVYGIDNDTGLRHSQAPTTVVASSDTVWMVIKLDFIAGTETLFINPTRGSGPESAAAKVHLPMTPEFQASGFNQIDLKEGYNLGAFTFDELRVGTTFADIRR